MTRSFDLKKIWINFWPVDLTAWAWKKFFVPVLRPSHIGPPTAFILNLYVLWVISKWSIHPTSFLANTMIIQNNAIDALKQKNTCEFHFHSILYFLLLLNILAKWKWLCKCGLGLDGHLATPEGRITLKSGPSCRMSKRNWNGKKIPFQEDVKYLHEISHSKQN